MVGLEIYFLSILNIVKQFLTAWKKITGTHLFLYWNLHSTWFYCNAYKMASSNQ